MSGDDAGSGGLDVEAIYDAVVIGTGFGGSVAAARIADAIEAKASDGTPRYPTLQTALVLERGRRYQPGDFPRPPLPQIYPGQGGNPLEPVFDEPPGSMWWPLDGGLWDVRPMGDLLVIQAAGYGGGSLIYANVQMQPPEAVLRDRWGFDEAARAQMQDGYALGAWRLGARPCPPGLQKARGFRAGLEGWGDQVFSPRLAVHFGPSPAAAGRSLDDAPDNQGRLRPVCTFCGACDLGCNVGAKNTLDLTYLARAEAVPPAAMRIQTQSEVHTIRPARPGEGPAGHWLVGWWDLMACRAPRWVCTPRVFLGAGAVNSTELLLRSRAEFGALPAHSGLREGGPLGARVWANGDAIGGIFRTKTPVVAHDGPVITSAVVARTPPAQGDEAPVWLMAQDAGLPRRMMPFLRWFSGPLRPLEGGETRAGARTDSVTLGTLLSLAESFEGATPQRPVGTSSVARLQRFGLDLLELQSQSAEDGAELAGQMIQAAVARKFPGFLGDLIRTIGPKVADWAIDDAAVDAVVSALIGLGAERASSAVRFDVADAHMQPVLLMGHDVTPGRLYLDPEWDDEARIEWSTADNRALYDAQARLLREMANHQDGVLRINPVWQLTGTPLTVHVLGGCAIDSPAGPGVTDPYGAVHGHPGLVVVDAGVFPSSVGANPSATIVAFAERAMAHHLSALGAPFEAPELAQARAWYAANPEPLFDAVAAPPRLPDPTATVGLTFCERMVGHATPMAHLGQVEPARQARLGARLGRRHGQRIVAEFEVAIPDLEAFLEGAGREAALTGSVLLDKTRCRVLPGSTLALLPKGPQRSRAQMVYRVRCAEPDGRVWHLEGRKALQDNHGYDVLRDTTHLHVRLWPADTPDALSKGVLKVHLDDLLNYQLPSFDVTGVHPDDLGAQLMVLARFLGFFVGRLAQVYVRSALDLLLRRRETLHV